MLVILAPSGSALAEGEAVADDTPPPGIVFASDVGDTIWAMDANGDNQRQLTTDRSGDPAWSPNGTRIAYTRYNGSTYDGVWVMDTDGRNQRRLTNGFTGGPSWSPDSTHLTYSGPVGIGVVNADSAVSHQITINSDWGPAWSPNG